MRGLLLKEFYYCKWYLLVYGIIYIVFFVVDLTTNIFVDYSDPYVEITSFMTTYLLSTFFYLFTPISNIANTFAYDERSNFDKFILTSGVKRDTVVTTKFVFSVICYAFPFVLFVIETVILFVGTDLAGSFSPLIILPLILLFICEAVFFTAFNVFILARFGQMKHSVILSLSYIIFCLIEFALQYYVILEFIESPTNSILIAIIAGAIMLLLSFVLIYFTYTGYKKREF